MVIWNDILSVWIYPLAVLGPVLDGISTVLLLEYANEAEELNSGVEYLHNQFGLRKGQAIFSVFATPLWVGTVHLVHIWSGLAITSLFVGMYLGFSIKQLFNGYSAYSGG